MLVNCLLLPREERIAVIVLNHIGCLCYPLQAGDSFLISFISSQIESLGICH